MSKEGMVTVEENKPRTSSNGTMLLVSGTLGTLRKRGTATLGNSYSESDTHGSGQKQRAEASTLRKSSGTEDLDDSSEMTVMTNNTTTGNKHYNFVIPTMVPLGEGYPHTGEVEQELMSKFTPQQESTRETESKIQAKEGRGEGPGSFVRDI